MQKNNSRDDAHARIALIIKSAKRRMFKASREGVNLRVVMDRFNSEVAAEFENMIPHRADDNDDAVWDAIERRDDDKLIDLIFPETEAGDADDDRKVLRAIYELLHNPQTPEDLYQEISEFVTTQSNQCDGNLYHSTSYLTEVLKSVKPEERMGVVLARTAGGGQ